jgi:septum formation protein
MPPLILASTSPYRRALMDRLGLPYTCERPRCDEEALKDPALAARPLAERLAEAKAASVAAAFPGAVVIGSDQVCALDDDILHKPGDRERTVAQLLRLQGRSHRLITAVSVHHPGGALRHTAVVTLHMRPLGRAALERYADADQPFDCAGAYKLERRGIALFHRIEAEDHDSIVGLPLLWLAGALADLGYPIP